MIGRLLCAVGSHDYQWSVTMTDPQLNWRKCARCGRIEEEYRHHYEMYEQMGTHPVPGNAECGSCGLELIEGQCLTRSCPDRHESVDRVFGGDS